MTGVWQHRRQINRDVTLGAVTLRFIPFFAFANREESHMRVWVPVRAKAKKCGKICRTEENCLPCPVF